MFQSGQRAMRQEVEDKEERRTLLGHIIFVLFCSAPKPKTTSSQKSQNCFSAARRTLLPFTAETSSLLQSTHCCQTAQQAQIRNHSFNCFVDMWTATTVYTSTPFLSHTNVHRVPRNFTFSGFTSSPNALHMVSINQRPPRFSRTEKTQKYVSVRAIS